MNNILNVVVLLYFFIVNIHAFTELKPYGFSYVNFNPENNNLYMANKNDDIISSYNLKFNTSIKIAGSTQGFENGECLLSRFKNPSVLQPYYEGSKIKGYFVGDRDNFCIRYFSLNNPCYVHTALGLCGNPSSLDGLGQNARMDNINTFTKSKKNFYYFSSWNQNKLRKATIAYNLSDVVLNVTTIPINSFFQIRTIVSVDNFFLINKTYMECIILVDYNTESKIIFNNTVTDLYSFSSIGASYITSVKQFGSYIFFLAYTTNTKPVYYFNGTNMLNVDCILPTNLEDFFIDPNGKFYVTSSISNLTLVNCNISKFFYKSEKTDSTTLSVTLSELEKSLSVSKSLSKNASLSKTNSETFSKTKTLSRDISLSNNKSVSKSNDESLTKNMSLSGNESRSENISLSKNMSLSSSKTSSKSMFHNKSLSKNISNSETLMESMSHNKSLSKNMSDSKTLSESVSLEKTKTLQVIEKKILHFTQTKTLYINQKIIPGLLTAAQNKIKNIDSLGGTSMAGISSAGIMSGAAASSGTRITATLKILNGDCNEDSEPAGYENLLGTKPIVYGNIMINILVPFIFILFYYSYHMIKNHGKDEERKKFPEYIEQKTFKEVAVSSHSIESAFVVWCIFMPTTSKEITKYKTGEISSTSVAIIILYLFLPGLILFGFILFADKEKKTIKPEKTENKIISFLFFEKFEWEINKIIKPMVQSYKKLYGFTVDIIISYIFSLLFLYDDCDKIALAIFVINSVYVLIIIFGNILQPNVVIIGNLLLAFGQIATIALKYKNYDNMSIEIIMYWSVILGTGFLLLPNFKAMYDLFKRKKEDKVIEDPSSLELQIVCSDKSSSTEF